LVAFKLVDCSPPMVLSSEHRSDSVGSALIVVGDAIKYSFYILISLGVPNDFADIQRERQQCTRRVPLVAQGS